MKPRNFKSARVIDALVPNKPGLYCIRIDDLQQLPSEYANILQVRQHNILYIGIASRSLQKRFLNQELRAKGHGTFFRSLGAILGYRPPVGSLRHRKNKRNFKFNEIDEAKIIAWINMNLQVNWQTHNQDIDQTEQALIIKHQPLLNLKRNPVALPQLKELRRKCVKIASSDPGDSAL